MSTRNHQRNLNLVKAYTDQPETLPPSVYSALEEVWGRSVSVQLYALADLNPQLQLSQTWICLGPTHLALVKMKPKGNEIDQVSQFPREQIKGVLEHFGLSCTTVTFAGADGEPNLGIIRFTHRQRQAVGAIIFVLRQSLTDSPFKVQELNADEEYAEALAQPIKSAQAAFSDTNRAVFWRLLGYLKPYKGQIILGFVAAFIMTALMMVPAFITGRLIDTVVTPFQDGEILWENAWKTAWLLLATLVTTQILRQFFLWIRLRWMAYIGEYIARDLRRDIYDHLHRLSVQYFSKMNTGSIISRVSSDSDRIWEFIAFGVTEASVSVLLIFSLTGMMMYLDWQLGLFVLLPLPIIFLLIYWNGKAMHGAFLRIWRKWSHLTSVISDTVPGIRVVKAFNQGDRERTRFGSSNNSYVDETFRIHNIWTSFWPLFILGIQMMQVAVWAFAIPRLIGGSPTGQPSMEIGVFVSFLLYLGLFFWPLETFAQISRMMNRSLSSAYRIFEVLDTEPEVVDKEDARKLDPVVGAIEFKDVIFGYDPVRQILKGVSFKVKPGEMIGLVGPSGAGKTTVINLIARFYDADSGEIRIDGHDIQDLDTGNYRSQLGMVMQDPYLFHGTILENIRYGQRDATVEQVIRASKAANAHDFICKLPQGYDTIVGERGHTLSGGERQRVSIARAILHDPKILILDEATSSVDTETERNIQEAIDRLTENRTVIAIAHRLSTLRKANRLFVMKEGYLVEEGTHEALLQKADGVYRKLYDMQRELHEAYAL